MTQALPRVNAKSSLRAAKVASAVIHLSIKHPAGDVGTRPVYLARHRHDLAIDKPAKLFRRRHFWQAAP